MIKKLLFPTIAFLALVAVCVATPKRAAADGDYYCDATDHCAPLAYWSCLGVPAGCIDKFCGHLSNCTW